MVIYGGRAESFSVKFSRVNSTSKNRRVIDLRWIDVQEQLRDQGPQPNGCGVCMNAPVPDLLELYGGNVEWRLQQL